MTFLNIWKPPTPVYPDLVTMSLSSQAVMSKPSPTVISNASIFPDSWKCSSCIQNSKINLRKTSNTIWLTILEKVTMLRYMSLTKLAASYWVCSHSSFRSVPIFPIITISSDTLEYICYYFLYPPLSSYLPRFRQVIYCLNCSSQNLWTWAFKIMEILKAISSYLGYSR